MSQTYDQQAVMAHLTDMLEHTIFVQADRQSRFLRFLVEEELGGRGEALNQYAIAMAVFDRDTSFDPLSDAIVRVEARRLRAKLREYYEDADRAAQLEIQLPKGRYRVHFAVREPTPQTAAKAQEPTIAVLAFDNLSSDPNQSYFSDGIAENIMTDLTKVPGLRVLSRHSTFIYKGRAVTCREISEDLGADYVLEGSVSRADSRLRIHAQLIEAATDVHVWAERFDRDSADVFAVQDDVTRQIVLALSGRLAHRSMPCAGALAPRDAEAYDYFLRAKALFYTFTPNGVLEALELLQTAIDREPEHPLMRIGRGRVLLFQFLSGQRLDRSQTLDPALEDARFAVEHASETAMAHGMLGWVLMWHGAIEEALTATQQALALGSGSAEVIRWRALVLASAGRGEDALVMSRRAQDLNPFYMVTDLIASGFAYFALGRYSEALTEAERGLRRAPNFALCRLLQLACLGQLEERDKAEEALLIFRKLRASEHFAEKVTFFNEADALKRFRAGLATAGI
jgi:TolB-like protein/Flp pilus assembly protein TadD